MVQETKKRPKPQTRAYYGSHIAELLLLVPAEFAARSKHHADTVNFLSKMASYLQSEDYAIRSEIQTKRKHAWIAKTK